MDMTEIIKAFVYLIAAAASAALIPWLRTKIGSENMARFLSWVDIGVAAAEQLYDSAHGAEKKAYVIAFLAEKGFRVDEEEMNVAVEAAVNRLHAELYGAERDGEAHA